MEFRPGAAARRWAAGLGVFAASVGLQANEVRASPSTGSDAAADAEAETVVLLHGLGRSATNMLVLEWRLRARGYRTCNLDYDTRVASIEQVVARVAPEIARCSAAGGVVHFVTHSLGGLVLRALLGRESVPGAGRAVMLAPPNAGSEIADRLRGIAVLETVLGPLMRQLGTQPRDLPGRLPAPTIPFGVIAGDRWVNPAGPLWLPAPHDGTVSVASTRLEGMQDHIVLPYTHTFIMNAEEVADQIDAFLRRGRFDRAGPSRGSWAAGIRHRERSTGAPAGQLAPKGSEMSSISGG